MIAYREIKKALTALLKSEYPEYKVHFDNVEKSDAPYFYVELMPAATTVDPDYTDRLIQADITFIQPRDRSGRIDRTKVFDVADELDKLIRPVLAIEDRHITVLGSETTVADDILHYIFTLDFTDGTADRNPDGTAAGEENGPLMQTLGFRLNSQDYTETEEEE